MFENIKVGKLGEDIVCLYLINKGYRIIERNFRKSIGELDVIAIDPANHLVFIEVKTMRQFGNAAIRQYDNSAIRPEDNLTVSKLKKLKRIASLYAGLNQNFIDDEKGWRIDLVTVEIPENLLVAAPEKLLRFCEIKHFENIVDL